MASPASAYDFVERGLYKDAALTIDRTQRPTTDLVVLRAKLESHIGVPSDAKASAERLLRQHLTSRERTTCWEIIGRVSLSSGQISDGLRSMQQAFSAADDVQEPKLEARLTAGYTEALLHCVGIEEATSQIPKLRQTAVRAGDPQALVTLHSVDAEIKLKRGLLSSAALSLETARNLLERFPNVAQQGQVSVIETILAIRQCDYEGALRSASDALSKAEATGSRAIRIAALGNIAYIRITLRELDEARKSLDQLLATVLKGSSTEIGALDTEMMFALAADDLNAATRLAEKVESLTIRQESRNTFYEVWHLPTRVRWLYRLENYDRGVALALESLPRIDRKMDQHLSGRLKLLAAEGLGRSGKSSEAVALVAEAVAVDSDPSLELLAECLRVAGRLAIPTDEIGARAHFKQACGILRNINNLQALAEVERDVVELLGSDSWTDISAEVEPSTDPQIGDAKLASFANRLGTFVELGSHVPSLATETLSLLTDTGCVEHCHLIHIEDSQIEKVSGSSKPGGALAKNLRKNIGTFRIDLGVHRGQRYEIVATPKPNISAQLTFGAVARVVSSAVATAAARQLKKENASLWNELAPEHQLGLICSSERMVQLVKMIRQVAGSNVTVLLTGETGVGKELFARALHQASPRHDKTFLPFNCGTVPRDLLDSQLFGHRRGAFTGAHADSAGVIRSAAAGTLFLDEIGEMAVETQPKLLRFLESSEILPLGETKPQLVDVRVVAATNANLDQMVAEGRFREDLFYRLNVIRIPIPPLRERREEIPALVDHFLEKYGRELHKPLLRVADETLEYLVLYRWPGNVRQLSNELRRMVALAEPGAVLMPAHLSDDIVASRRTMPVGQAPRGFSEVVTRIDQPLSAAVEHIERAAIQRAMSVTDGNLVEAAKLLGLSRKGLYLKRQRLKLG